MQAFGERVRVAMDWRKGRVIGLVLLLAVLLLGWAWINGGRRAPHPIAQEVPVPESVK